MKRKRPFVCWGVCPWQACVCTPGCENGCSRGHRPDQGFKPHDRIDL